jgi:hypothetical protein
VEVKFHSRSAAVEPSSQAILLLYRESVELASRYSTLMCITRGLFDEYLREVEVKSKSTESGFSVTFTTDGPATEKTLAFATWHVYPVEKKADQRNDD